MFYHSEMEMGHFSTGSLVSKDPSRLVRTGKQLVIFRTYHHTGAFFLSRWLTKSELPSYWPTQSDTHSRALLLLAQFSDMIVDAG